MTVAAGRTFAVGSLLYSRAGLVNLFVWLIWGDFVMVLMESVAPSLVPLLLKNNGANNEEIIVIVSTLAMVMNACLNPVISYKSDRFRSRWGRRRPFIAITTPFVVFFLLAIPYAPEIFRALHSYAILARLFSLSPVPALILVFGGLVLGFQTFHLFVGTTYYYLVPDVVPQQLLGRFYALFRIAGHLALITFNYFIFGFSQGHMKMIFGSIAVAYGFFILLMCWQVKEGDYPPPPKEDHSHWWSGVRNYARECFGTSSYYWWVFLTYAALSWTSISNVFSVFFFRDEMGLSLDTIGKMTAWASMLFIVLAYPCGVLVDRWGCQKTFILSLALMAVSPLLMFFFAHDRHATVVWFIIRSTPTNLAFLALAKWTVEVYPQDRYGQFASAGALFSSIGGIILGPVCGWWMDTVRDYRFFLLWNAIFSILCMAAAVTVYRKWKVSEGQISHPTA